MKRRTLADMHLTCVCMIKGACMYTSRLDIHVFIHACTYIGGHAFDMCMYDQARLHVIVHFTPSYTCLHTCMHAQMHVFMRGARAPSMRMYSYRKVCTLPCRNSPGLAMWALASMCAAHVCNLYLVLCALRMCAICI